MRFLTEKYIARLNLISALIIVALLALSMGYISVSRYYKESKVRAEIFKKDYFKLTKEKIKASVNIQIHQVESKNSRVDQDNKNYLIENVYKAYRITENLYRKHRNIRNPKEILNNIVNTLAVLNAQKYPNYYFILDEKGTNLLHSEKSGIITGKNYFNIKNSKGHYIIRDMLGLLEDRDEDFYQYHWRKPGYPEEKEYPKLSFIRKFKPLSIIIGSGIYLDDIENSIKSKMLKRINSICDLFEDNTFLSVYELTIDDEKNPYFKTLVHPETKLLNTEISPATTDIETAQTLKKVLEGLKNNGEIFISHKDARPGRTTKEGKISFFKFYPRWNWIFVRGFYTNDLETIITKQKKEFKKDLKKEINSFVFILLLFIGLSIAVSVISSKGIHKIIVAYRDKVNRQNIQLREREQELLKLNKILDETGRTDPLTGLSNRRDMSERLAHYQALFNRNKRSFSIVMADIDYFKSINDAYGHDTGDFILKWIAKFLKDSTRAQDIVSRWGGEEFLLLLPETDLKGAFILAEKIRTKIANASIIREGVRLNITLTFGLSTYDKETNIEEVIKNADEALYEGKKNGRNQTVTKK